jgi:hypothetical protein
MSVGVGMIQAGNLPRGGPLCERVLSLVPFELLSTASDGYCGNLISVLVRIPRV